MSRVRDAHIGWRFWLAWVLASTLGVAAIFAIGSATATIVGAVVGGGAEDKVPFVPLVGPAVGIAQWLVLRRHVPRAGWWVLASTAGWLAAIGVLAAVIKAVEYRMGGPVEGEVAAAVFFPAVGAALGILQWLVLRRHRPRAGWWVLASAVGWVALGAIVGKSLDRVTDLVAIAAVPPAITGAALAWLLRQSSGPSNVGSGTV